MDDDDIGIVGVFCNYKEPEKAVNLIGSLLQQIALRQSDISDDIRHLYKTHVTKCTRPSIFEYSTLLKAECRPLSTLFIVIDALDECSSESKDKFLKELQDLGPKLRLMITSRPSIMGITDYFQDVVHLEIHASNEDIKTYLTERLQSESRFKSYIQAEPSLHNDIIKAILDKAEGMLVSIYDILY
jgi:ankyrin repeat domain-containing protein 50